MKRCLAFVIDRCMDVAGYLLEGLLIVPGWRRLCDAGAWLGRRTYARDQRHRAMLMQELEALYRGRGKTAGALEQIARQSFENDRIRLVETTFLCAMTRKRIDRIVGLRGQEHLDAALSRGRGVILLLAHYGSFMLPLPALGHRGYKINQIVGVTRTPTFLQERIFRWRQRQGARLPVRFIHVDTFLRPLIEALGRNEIVVIAFDGRDAKRWVEARLLARTAQYSSGPFSMARKTGAAIVPTFMVRENRYQHTCVMEPPFELAATGSAAEANDADTVRFAALFESYVERYPDHFGMILVKVREAAEAGITPPLFIDPPAGATPG